MTHELAKIRHIGRLIANPLASGRPMVNELGNKHSHRKFNFQSTSQHPKTYGNNDTQVYIKM